MASTRNKNTPGDYALEQWSLKRQFQKTTYHHGAQGKAFGTMYAGNGLIGGRMHGRDLAQNDCDIESYLFGIGSTNLVKPKSDPVPEFKSLNSLNMIHKKETILPESLIIEPNQRPFYLN